MSNYSVTGHVTEAANALSRALSSIPAGCSDDAPDGKLRLRVLRAMRTVESIEKQAKKLIPGGWQHRPNLREQDKRAQMEELSR